MVFPLCIEACYIWSDKLCVLSGMMGQLSINRCKPQSAVGRRDSLLGALFGCLVECGTVCVGVGG